MVAVRHDLFHALHDCALRLLAVVERLHHELVRNLRASVPRPSEHGRRAFGINLHRSWPGNPGDGRRCRLCARPDHGRRALRVGRLYSAVCTTWCIHDLRGGHGIRRPAVIPRDAESGGEQGRPKRSSADHLESPAHPDHLGHVHLRHVGRHLFLVRRAHLAAAFGTG